MPERKPWSHEEDAALKTIVSRGVKKWTIVAKTMEDEYKIYGRTGKQCRQRWFNQLDPNINSSIWSEQQQKLLYKLHNQLGNSWSKISNMLKGRTDNQVKNHFYSTIRKSFRRLNRHILDCKSQKQLKSITLTKLLAAAEDKFDRKLNLSAEVVNKSIDLKNRLLKLAYDIQDNRENASTMNSLVKEMGDFTKTWKRKKKRGKKEVESAIDDLDVGSFECQQSSFEQVKTLTKRRSLKQQISQRPSREGRSMVKKDVKQKKKMKEQPQGFSLIKRSSSRIVSVNGSISGPAGSIDQPLPLQRLSSAFSLHDSEDDLMLIRRRSSSRSSFSIFGSNNFGRFSDFQVPRVGFNLTDSQNNIGSKNLFEFPPESLLQRLDE